MRIKNIATGLLLAGSFYVNAQNSSKEILFKIDEKPYYTDEFIRIYNKNIDLVKDDSQKDLDHYLDLFIGYKLKINKAHKLNLNENQSYINELKSYRNQFARKYLTDSKVTKELVEEAYKRYLKEINASHILVMVGENASPADTLKAYNKILDIRKKALSGTPFEELANKYSEDKYGDEGVQNGGNLGYFSVLRMVYPFENGAYKTKVGEISEPVRTRFGYHLIKVNDIRDNRGSIAIAHIMILKKTDQADDNKAKRTVDEVYSKIQQGEKFEELAMQFSEDKATSVKGGVLNRFSSGELSSEKLEDAAFLLSNENPVSKPIETDYGYHILKFIERFPVKSFEEMESELENKIKRDDRSILITNSLNEKLKQKYLVKRNDKVYADAVKTINDTYYNGDWKTPAQGRFLNETLFSIKEKNISGGDFLNYVESQQRILNDIKPITRLADKLYEKFIELQLNTYYNDNLENEIQEFGEGMEEYRDGLLLFDLMEKEIWEKAKTDTLGLENYYNRNIDKYVWKDRYDVIIISSTQQDVIKQAHKYLKQKKSADFIKEKLNQNGKVNVIEKIGVFEADHDAMPKSIKLKKGLNDIFKERDYYYAFFVNEIKPAGNKTLEECKGKVINDYQQYLEENLVSELKKEFDIKVDKEVFNTVKRQIKR